MNCSLTEANFSSSGYFMFCSIFTCEEDGDNIWFTASDEFSGNDDVYAWREGMGPITTFTSPLYLSTGGNCLECPYLANTTDVAGEVEIKWVTPIDAELTVGETTLNVRSQFYHAGLNANNIDFITNGLWQMIETESFDVGQQLTPKVKNLAFRPMSESEITEINVSSDIEGPFPYVPSFDYYIGELVPKSLFIADLLIEYNPETGVAMSTSIQKIAGDLIWQKCGGSANKSSVWNKGYILLTKESVSRLYYDYDDTSCPDELTIEDKRIETIVLSRIPQYGNDLREMIELYYPVEDF